MGRASRATIPDDGGSRPSREHFRLDYDPPLCHLIDLGSTNGTKVNGLRVESVLLREGDTITAGDSTFRVHYGGTNGEASSLSPSRPAERARETENPLSAADDPPTPRPAFGLLLCDDCEVRQRQFPDTSSDYLIEGLIGEGGMGSVYREASLRNSPRGHQDDDRQWHRRRESTQLFPSKKSTPCDMLMPGGKCHPSIVEFYDLFQSDGQFQLVMEYVDGKKNALEWVQALKEPMPIATAAMIGQQLLSAALISHTQRDMFIAIQALQLAGDGPLAHRPRVKLSDFGMAKSMAGKAFSRTSRARAKWEARPAFSLQNTFASSARCGRRLISIARGDFVLHAYRALPLSRLRSPSNRLIRDDSRQSTSPASRADRPDAPEGLELASLLKALRKRPHPPWKSAEFVALQEPSAVSPAPSPD